MSDEDSLVRINIEGYGTVEADISVCDILYHDHREEISDVIAKVVADVMTLVDPRFKDAKFHPVLGMQLPEQKRSQGVDHSWPVYDH